MSARSSRYGFFPAGFGNGWNLRDEKLLLSTARGAERP
jgi:hypothetical protein